VPLLLLCGFSCPGKSGTHNFVNLLLGPKPGKKRTNKTRPASTIIQFSWGFWSQNISENKEKVLGAEKSRLPFYLHLSSRKEQNDQGAGTVNPKDLLQASV
jgi:hypothetical protein